jgi:hypothetical protein
MQGLLRHGANACPTPFITTPPRSGRQGEAKGSYLPAPTMMAAIGLHPRRELGSLFTLMIQTLHYRIFLLE